MKDSKRYHTILVMDDEERLRKTLGKSLRDQDRETLTAASPEDALALLKTRNIDLVITDLAMPGMEGTKLLKEIKKASPDVKMIVITGYPSTMSVKEAGELGVNHYLQKPFDLAELKSIVIEQLAAGIHPGGNSKPDGRPWHVGILDPRKGEACSEPWHLKTRPPTSWQRRSRLGGSEGRRPIEGIPQDEEFVVREGEANLELFSSTEFRKHLAR